MDLVGTTIRQKVASRTRMLLALALVLATLVAAPAPAAPALAQEGGVVDEDKATQEQRAAKEGVVDREEGAAKEEVIKEGADQEEGAAKEEGVTKREAAREGDSQDDKATLSFELTVEGEPPADAAFFGNVHTGEGGPGRYVPLADPDDDGVYTGSTVVDRFGPGPRPVPPGVEPVSFPVKMVQGTDGEAYRSIKDFGTVKLDGDKAFSASVSFDDEEPNPEEVSATGRIGQIADFPGASHTITDEASGDLYFLTSDGVDLQDYAVSGERVIVYGTPVPNRYTTDTTLNVTRVEPAGTTPPPDEDGGSGNNGGSDNDSGSDDSGSGGSGSGGSSGGSSGGIANGIRGALPSTGGSMALTLLGAGVLMAGGGLLVRRLAR